MSKTLFEKIWDSHLVLEEENGPSLLYIDRHLIHEVTSPQAFEGLRLNNRKVRRPDLTIATEDHNVPTSDRSLPIVDQVSSIQIKTLEKNCKDFGIQLFGINNPNQGIVHVIGPQLGITLPGSTIVCGDSHTSTQGAFGALAFGIGTSEVEHVLATQCLLQRKPKTCEVRINGTHYKGVSAKDIILEMLRHFTGKGGVTKAFEYGGPGVKTLTVPERATITNMGAELGATTSIFPSDEKTFTQALEAFERMGQQRFFSVILMVTNHEPFAVPAGRGRHLPKWYAAPIDDERRVHGAGRRGAP